MSDDAYVGLVQVIIDNFDTFINSLNCCEECHVLAMISIQSARVLLNVSLSIPPLELKKHYNDFLVILSYHHFPLDIHSNKISARFGGTSG